MSGSRPQCSSAKNRPVRPMPVCTSSQTKSVPVARQAACAPSRYPSGGWFTPLPWTGSTMNAATSPRSSSRRSAVASPNGTAVQSASRGPKPSRNSAFPFERERSERQAVERVLRVEDARPPGRRSGELDGALDRLGSAVGAHKRLDLLPGNARRAVRRARPEGRSRRAGGGSRLASSVSCWSDRGPSGLTAPDGEGAEPQTADRGIAGPRGVDQIRPLATAPIPIEAERAHDLPELAVHVAVVDDRAPRRSAWRASALIAGRCVAASISLAAPSAVVRAPPVAAPHYFSFVSKYGVDTYDGARLVPLDDMVVFPGHEHHAHRRGGQGRARRARSAPRQRLRTSSASSPTSPIGSSCPGRQGRQRRCRASRAGRRCPDRPGRRSLRRGRRAPGRGPADGRTRELQREYRAVVEEILELRGADHGSPSGCAHQRARRSPTPRGYSPGPRLRQRCRAAADDRRHGAS